MTRAEVLGKLADAKPWLRAQGVTRLRLFGSFARDEASAESDVDLLVDLEAPRSLLELIGLEQDLARRLGRPVDLAVTSGLKPRVQARIAAEAVDV